MRNPAFGLGWLLILGMIAPPVLSQESILGVNVEVKANPGDERYRLQLIDELTYEFSLHKDIVCFGYDVQTNSGTTMNSRMYRFEATVVDLGNGLFVFSVYSLVFDPDDPFLLEVGVDPIESYWTRGPYDSLGSMAKRMVRNFVEVNEL